MQPAAQFQRERAIRLAAAWASSWNISGKTFEAAVTSVEEQTVQFVRARWIGQSRRVVAREAPTASRSRKLLGYPDASSFDPWNAPANLSEETRRLTMCRGCKGDRKVVCPDCRGAARLKCTACGGGGRRRSSRTHRIINCKYCRGKGHRKCGCRDGLVCCLTCLGKGKLEAWLEVAEEVLGHVTTTTPNQLRAAFQKAEAFGDFDHGNSWPVAPRLSWSGRVLEEAPREVQELLRNSPGLPWEPAPRPDRLERVDLQWFQSTITRVRFQFFQCSGEIEIPEWSEHVQDSSTARTALRYRQQVLSAIFTGALFLSLMLAGWYTLRHSFYAGTTNALWLWCLAPVLAFLVLPPVLQFALPAASRQKRWSLTALPALLLVATLGVFAGTGQPSVAHARALAESGDTPRALAEAKAGVELGIDAARAGALHDELQVEMVEELDEPEEVWEAVASRLFLTPLGRQCAEAHGVAVTVERARSLQDAGEFSASEDFLRLIPEAHQEDVAIRALWRRFHTQRVNVLWSTIHANTVDLVERLDACAAAAPSTRYLDAVPGPETAPDAAQVDRQCAQLETRQQEELARKQRQAAQERERQQRAAELARKREEQAHLSAVWQWQRAPLLCRDGTLSPSCVCGQGSRRGCCSHHGGVSGCSRLPPRRN